MQTELTLEPMTVSIAKQQLRQQLSDLNATLDRYLAVEYNIDQHNLNASDYSAKLAQWQKSHQPFHWYVQFYEIMQNGGFDVIIGNPPYVEYKDVKNYRVHNYIVENCGDLFAFTLERGISLASQSGNLGFIIPMSGFTVDGFKGLQDFYYRKTSQIFISHWSGDAHPSKLFEGVDKRLEIVIAQRKGQSSSSKIYTSKYLKWYAEERKHLFSIYPVYQYIKDAKEIMIFSSSIPKVGTPLDIQVIHKLLACTNKIGTLTAASGKYLLYYTRKASFFLQFLDFIPEVRDGEGALREPSELKTLLFETHNIHNLCLASLSSSLFYWYYIVNSDCRDLNKREIITFPIASDISWINYNALDGLLKKLMESYKRNSTLRTVEYAKKGKITVQYFNFRPSKPIIDEIDRVLARHYGFTDEELDFIINYDIKYRMGHDSGDEDEG